MVKPTVYPPERRSGQSSSQSSGQSSSQSSSQSSESPDRRAAKDLSKQDLSQVLPAIWEAETIEQSIQAALEAIRAEFGYTLLWAGLYDRFNHQLTTRGVITSGPRRFSHTSLALHPGDVLEQVIVQQQPTVIADIQVESRAGAWARIAKSFEQQGTVILPIVRKGICFGLIILGSRRWGVELGILENSTLLAVNNALAEAIHQDALEVQRQQTKQPAKPLLSLLGSLSVIPGLDARLEVIAEETQTFVAAPVSLYWLEPRGRYFWCRAGGAKGRADSQLPVSEVTGLYQKLCAEEMIVLGEREGSLKASVASRLMQHLKVQSLIAAPLMYQGELQGVITIEGAS
ncbi:MAG: GAF domain-containing protein, partial [Phormidesmis sp.]